VLARELSLAEIESIRKRCGDTELEVFVHGALCYSISGLCLYGAMEKDRSGNRGKCPYCCRQGFEVEKRGGGGQRCASSLVYPFSMKDLRLGEDVKKLAQLGVASLKIEGHMKSALYVASVVRYYRQILGGGADGRRVSIADLETVFSRRTTELLFNEATTRASRTTNHEPRTTNHASPIDPESLGHRGTPIGTVKRITKDREGRAWLRFHTLRALEKHDGLQFEALTDEGRHFGFGIAEMRQAISRAPVFEVAAGADVEILLPDAENAPIREGDTVYCSMSNAVKRAFPTPSFRPSAYPGTVAIDLKVTLKPDGIQVLARRASGDQFFVGATILSPQKDEASADGGGRIVAPTECHLSWKGRLEKAKAPEKTEGAVEKAFSKLGETDYRLGELELVDEEKLFVPASVLNDLRRDLVEALDDERERERAAKIDAAVADLTDGGDRIVAPTNAAVPPRTLKIRLGQIVPAGEWDEIVIAITPTEIAALDEPPAPDPLRRLALPVWNGELEFNSLRNCVKGLIRAGFAKWECSDLATLRMLRQLGVTDIVADWSLYAFNSAALAGLSELGVKRFVASPENGKENLAYLAESGYSVEFLVQQSTPLFISRHRPAAPVEGLSVYEHGGLWVTTRPVPRTFAAPSGAPTRVDLSWDA